MRMTPIAGRRALEIANAAREIVRELLRGVGLDAREHALQDDVRPERARRAREHDVTGALEQRLDVADLPRDAVVREDREVERVVEPEGMLCLLLELRDVVVETQLLAEQARRRER